MAPSKNYWVGFDLGGTKMLAGIFNENFKVLARAKKRTQGSDGKKAGVRRMIQCIDEALEEAKVAKKNLAGICLACPGPLDLDKGILIHAPNLGWSNVKLKEIFEEEYGCPVFIGNDVDIGVYGEYRFGAGKKARCLVGLFPGTGIGGGMIYRGEIFRGKKTSCLEVGHIVMQANGPIGPTNVNGTLESVASRLAMSEKMASAAYRGQAPYLKKIAGTDISFIRSSVIRDSINEGDKKIEEIVRDGAYWLGVGAANMINLVAPDVLILGGGLVESLPELYLEEVDRGIAENVMTGYEGVCKVTVAKLGDDAGILGAAAWAEHSVKNG